MTFFSRITISRTHHLRSRPEHLKTSNASLSIPGFQRSHHAPSGPARQYGVVYVLHLLPDPSEMKKIAAEGILTCFQDAIDSLNKGESDP
ncbi:hypothetical protein Tco_0541234 [Tanacetum coccineum]